MLGYCYQCERECNVRDRGGDVAPGDPLYLCAQCGGDFLELCGEGDPGRRAAPVEGARGTIPNGTGEQDATTGRAQGDAASGLDSVSALIETVAGTIHRINPVAGVHTAVLHFSAGGADDEGSQPTGFIQLSSVSGADPFDAILSRLGELHQPQHVAADPRAVESLPRRRLEAPEAEPCVVCQDGFRAGDKLVDLACRHCFHEGCILPWLQSHNTCPVCREVVGGHAAAETEPRQEVATTLTPEDVQMDVASGSPRSSAGDDDPDGRSSSIDVGATAGATHVAGRGESEGTADASQRGLAGLQERLLEQLEEHQTLRSQVQRLQVQRASLQSEFGQLHTQAQEAVTQLHGLLDRYPVPSQAPDQQILEVLNRLNEALGQHVGVQRNESDETGNQAVRSTNSAEAGTQRL